MAKVALQEEETPISEYHKYEVVIKGITPVIWNRILTDFSKPQISPKVKVDAAENEWRIWRDKLHVIGDDERVYFPSENVHEAINGGATYWGAKISMKPIHGMTRRGLSCEPMSILDHEGNPVFKNSKSILPFEKKVRTGRSGTIVYIVRPMLAPGWEGRAIVHVWDPRLSKDIMTTILRFTGQYNGIGDFRKYYGRFELVSL